MKVLYDHQIFNLQTHGGISRYFAEIINHLPAHVSSETSLHYSKNAYFRREELLSDILLERAKKEKKRSRLFSKKKASSLSSEKIEIDLYAYNKEESVKALIQQNFDLFHPTYYDNYFLEHIGNKPFVVTIHDMIYELYPEMLMNFQIPEEKKTLVLKASHIIAVSEKTKKDIIDILNMPEEKISVVYHANSLEKCDLNNGELPIDLPDNYFLFVGERGFYKNFLFFARGIEPILKAHENIYVLCTGKSFTEEEIAFLNSLNIGDRFLHKFIPDSSFFEVYSNAIALVFPSYSEGFGIPILEAFYSSCPVILSRIACFEEVAKDAALYFDPKSMAELRRCIQQILDDRQLSDSLIAKGKKRVADFSWELSAKQTYEVYQKVLAGK